MMVTVHPMNNAESRSSLMHRYLDPSTSLAEVLFGLIMTLTFTLGAGMVIENEGLSKILNVGFATPEKLSPEEWIRCSYYMFMQFNAWEYLYYQNRDESIPKELWVGADESFKQFIETKPGYGRFWSEFEAAFDEPFRSYVANEFAKKAAKK
jgi:hypothetical protein